MLVVFLCVFNSDIGVKKLDIEMGEGRTSKFIHVFELMLLMETFCLYNSHVKLHVKKFKLFMPYLLNTLKTTLNRQTGCQMKIIKFHLPNHFADDILRFGSMANYDTGIGESHHKSLAKQPGKNTQRRRNVFELQTAKRQIENLSINMALSSLENSQNNTVTKKDNDDNSSTLNKSYRYTFHVQNKICKYMKKDKRMKSKQMNKCNWKDSLFQQQLTCECEKLNEVTDFQFFTQHNRSDFIFRGDPSFSNGEPWYDWVTVLWNEENIPAKILLFWEISDECTKMPFQFGNNWVTHSGTYVIAYSLLSTKNIIKAHGASLLVQFGDIDKDKNNIPKLFIFPVESIIGPITAIPYYSNDNIIDAQQWIFLRPKSEWYEIFVNLMNETLHG